MPEPTVEVPTVPPEASSFTAPKTAAPDTTGSPPASSQAELASRAQAEADRIVGLRDQIGVEIAGGPEKRFVPEKIFNNPKFQEAYESLKTNGENLSEQQLQERAADRYYESFAEDAYNASIPKEIQEDPLFQQKYREAISSTDENGVTPGLEVAQKKALAEYQKAKDKLPENLALNKPEEVITVEEKIAQLEKENAEIKAELQEIKKLLGELVKHAAETDPEKKKNLLIEILKIAAIVLGSAFIETGKQVTPPLKS